MCPTDVNNTNATSTNNASPAAPTAVESVPDNFIPADLLDNFAEQQLPEPRLVDGGAISAAFAHDQGVAVAAEPVAEVSTAAGKVRLFIGQMKRTATPAFVRDLIYFLTGDVVLAAQPTKRTARACAWYVDVADEAAASRVLGLHHTVLFGADTLTVVQPEEGEALFQWCQLAKRETANDTTPYFSMCPIVVEQAKPMTAKAG